MFKTKDYFENLKIVLNKLDHSQIDSAVSMVKQAIDNENKIFTCGNGGSAYAASHFITDWNKMFTMHTGRKFRGVSLCDNLGLVTAYANDVNYQEVFSRQLSSLADQGDLLIVVSGSGNSPNIIQALKKAQDLGMKTLAFVGYDGGGCKQLSDNLVHIPSWDMQYCEDIHLMLGHIIMKNICGYSINMK
jgi:D-sedoheptulose 7-phosphate isomerase